MTDERRESVALPVIGVLNVLDMADGDQFEFVLALTIIAVLDVQSAEITGGDVGAHLHRALVAYIEDPQRAISELDDALVLDGGNPLLYAYRAVTHVRAGNFAEAEIDMQTAERLGPDGWAMPAYFSGGSTPEEALENVETVTELRPDDWFAYFAWGIIMYTDLNDPDAAKALLDQSIALGPEASMPYVPSMLIALRDGRIADAQNFARIILTEFPDPELIILAYSTLYGDAVSQGQFTSAYFSTATNIVLGQYARVTQEMVAVEEAVTALPADQEVTALADMFLFQGLAYCNLDDYAQAEAAYSSAIRFNGDFTLLYALRGQMRQTLGATADAENDFRIAQAHDLGATFDPWVSAALAGEWTCGNFFDYDLSGAGAQ
jgi:tetratricopeptide (TPR) repeat protein